MDETFFTFNKNGSYLFSFDGDTDNGTWEFASDEQKLVMDKGTDDEHTVDILKLTATSLNIEWQEEDLDTGEKYKVEMRLVHD
ncbi:hypothetical protein MKJ04_17615 [Pontibacter sp. E15-1]|uniref:hypothetical protein n=1 Tax=Pontibacter sp. E15-1 TaxID=2919918 RepID=UPI001F4F83CF|nr:hypothetical protein [Pontibacter sp. E15-1]MCJ8166668.1 hypothetical protein [Pontibacter sp. E15-1]